MGAGAVAGCAEAVALLVVAVTVVSVEEAVLPDSDGEHARQAIASAIDKSLIKICILLRHLRAECYYEGVRRQGGRGAYAAAGCCGGV